jgi:hypothetical protein
MPSNCSRDVDEGRLARSTTQKRRIKTNINNVNVRIIAQAKALDRKKVSLSYTFHILINPCHLI